MAKRSVDDDDKFVMHHYKNDKGETLTRTTNLYCTIIKKTYLDCKYS